MTSYQKLKKDVDLLKQQLFKIAEDPNSIESMQIIQLYKFMADSGQMFFYSGRK